jgi:UDP-glucuronate 4-epimerase
MNILVTGSAGFIGYHIATRLLADGHDVVGFDGMTPYYDVALKQARNALLQASPRFVAVEAMLEDRDALSAAIERHAPEIVFHLAAQAGVRHSLSHPEAFISANVIGTMNLFETLRARPPRHVLVASSSSVYGGNLAFPFHERARTDFPVSLYAASKKAAEALTHSYAHLYGVPVTCFRFFTAYGPWGRPDMALFKFVSAIERGAPIEVFGDGRMKRDFTYVGDIVEAISRLIDIVPETGVRAGGEHDSISPVAPWRTVNIAQGEPLGLMDFIATIERATARKAIMQKRPMQQGDVTETWADPALLRALTAYVPHTTADTGIAAFVDWYREWVASPNSR